MRSIYACALSLAATLCLACVDSSGTGSVEDLDGGVDSSVIVTESGVDSEFLPDTNVEEVELPDTADTAPPDTNVPDTMMPETCGLTVCGGACVDLQTDFNNCSKCGTKCAESVKFSVGCAAGACTCTAGETKCGASCKVTREDSTACTGCTTGCAKDEYCRAGACVCRPGLTLCGTECVDLAGDIDHCGMCGNACGGGQQCSSGMCGAKVPCPTGRTACDAGGGKVACFDLTTDATHCGACGTLCNADQLCIGGTCRKYAPAAGCSTCGGCSTCTSLFPGMGRCCPSLTGHTIPSCVDGPACP